MALAEGWPVPIPSRAPPQWDDPVDQRVVWVRGEHDASTVAALSETLARAVALDHSDLVVDLSGVEFMGVATVHVLDRMRAFLQARSRSMTLRSPSRPALLVLGLCDEARERGAAPALESWVAVPPVNVPAVRDSAIPDTDGNDAATLVDQAG